MPGILADRFLKIRRTRRGGADEWIDLASGDRVRVRTTPAGSRQDQLAWSQQSEALANLRHPLLCPLLDFGTAGGETFEVYGHIDRGHALRPRIQRHVVRFLDAHGVALAEDRVGHVLRAASSAGHACSRRVGVVLQHRRALDAVVEALDAGQPGGACGITVTGPEQSGLRTLRLQAARAARLRGFVPVTPGILGTHPSVAGHLEHRHLCVLVDESDPTVGWFLAMLLARLGAAGARRHVVLTFTRANRPGTRAIPIDPIGVSAMASMVFLDPDDGPPARDVRAAARGADGRPGLFLSRLGAAVFEPHRRTFDLVHETSPDYIVASNVEQRPDSGDAERAGGIARRSAARGEALARRGRHAAAARVLARTARVLRARGDYAAAGTCARARGWLALDRAQIGPAIDAFEEARAVCPEGPAGLDAAMGIGVAWTEDARLPESEAALRNALLAARSLGERSLAARVAAALARALYWQGRYDEAAAVLTGAFDPSLADADRAWLMMGSARVHAAEGATAPALRAARTAVQLAIDAGDPRLLASARRVLASALLVAGDIEGAREHVRQGLVSARQARLPLAAVRLQVVLLESMAGDAGDRSQGRRLAARLTGACARVPRLLRFQVRAACAAACGAAPATDVVEFIRSSGAVGLTPNGGGPKVNPVAELEAFLRIGQTASDDRAAIDRMAEDLRQKLRAGSVVVAGARPERRVLAVAGRPWPGDPQILWRTLAGGCPIHPDRDVEPCEAAEPIRYGGDVTGAVAARWIAGTALEGGRAMTLLGVGALAIAPHAQALLDRLMPDTGGATWKDLLGESDATRRLRDAIARSARAPFPVLIEGESGVGKELVARAIHRLGARRDRRFCAINCAALSDDLLEAELFGHARGAFTGAVAERPGLFEDADGGTLFLDEIGELSARAQAKLLRVLQDGDVRRIGENVSRKVDVRIIAATNRRLEHEAAAGRFRMDLRFRLDVVRIEVPPLRERAADVPLLALHFWTDAAARVGSRATLSPDALAAMSRYDWPGNVRELQNVIASMAVQSPLRGRIRAAALPGHLARASAPTGANFEAAREEFERRFVKAALAGADGHRMRAAASMGITRQGLAKMLRRLGLDGS